MTKKTTRTRKTSSSSSRARLFAKFDALDESMGAFGRDLDRVLDEATDCDVHCTSELARLGVRGGGY